MWTSLWTYSPTPEQLAHQEKKKAYARQIDALDQQVNDQRPEDEDEEKLRIFMSSAAADADGGEGSSATAADGRGAAGRGPTLSSFSIIPSIELDKALNECSGSLQNFILKVDWALLFPYHDETKIAEEKAELEAMQRKLEVAYYNLIAKVGPYRPLDPTLLSAAQIPQIVVPALKASGPDELLAGVGYKEEGQGVASFDVLQLDFCERLMRESNAMAFWSELVERRGVFAAYWGFRKTSKNRYVMTTPSLKGVLLNDANGSYPFLHALVKQAIEPVVSSHAEKTRNVRVSLQPRSCKLFSYCMDDIGMSDHFYHKSETGLAVNICLGRDFVGANLLIPDESGTRLSVPQVAGRALVFNAETKVSTETIMGGERYNMIIYCDVKEEPISQPPATTTTTTTTATAGEPGMGPQFLLDLPEPVKHRILSALSLNDLRALTLTSNALFKLVTYQSLPVWQQLCARHAYPHAQEENWRRSFINAHKSQLLKRWREQERKREQKKLFNEGLAEGYFMHDFDAVERFEEETGGLKRRHPWGQGADGEAGAAAGSSYYGVGQDGLQMPPQMWTCCVLQ